jgi:hypothetical protein
MTDKPSSGSAQGFGPPASTGRRGRAWTLPAAFGAIALCMLVGQLTRADLELELSRTSYGKTPAGYGALFDLLHELGVPVRRSRTAYPALPVQRSLWLIEPDFLDHERDAARPLDRRPNADETHLRELIEFVKRGGSAVVFGHRQSAWGRLFGVAEADKPGAEPEPAARHDNPRPQTLLSGTLASQPRRILGDGPYQFPEVDALEVLAQVDGAPFVVRKRLGKGSLVAVAAARPFSNAELDSADHSVLALDLVRAYGWPTFDERCHGLLASPSLLGALGAGRALLLAASLGLALLLWISQLRATPAVAARAPTFIDPSLASFVDSLGTLYGRNASRDVTAIHEAYRHGLRHRLRRSLYGATAVSDDRLTERLLNERRRDDGFAYLCGERTPRTPRELEAAVREMERCAQTMTAAHRPRVLERRRVRT